MNFFICLTLSLFLKLLSVGITLTQSGVEPGVKGFINLASMYEAYECVESLSIISDGVLDLTTSVRGNPVKSSI